MQDNGVGATPESLAKKLPMSLGLQGIRERVRLLGGEVTINTRKKGGFRLDVGMPAQQSASQWETS
ncbi:sensory histidine kinase UhpB [compost metagenome]